MCYGSRDQSADFEGDERLPIHLASVPHLATKPLTVARADLLGSAEEGWEELFAGYTALKAITFSSSLEMIMRMADRLADMEVVFGSESILSKEHLALTQASQTIRRRWWKRCPASLAMPAASCWNGSLLAPCAFDCCAGGPVTRSYI